MIYYKNKLKTNHFTRFQKNKENNHRDSIEQNQWDNYIKNKIPMIFLVMKRMKIIVSRKINHHSSFRI